MRIVSTIFAVHLLVPSAVVPPKAIQTNMQGPRVIIAGATRVRAIVTGDGSEVYSSSFDLQVVLRRFVDDMQRPVLSFDSFNFIQNAIESSQGSTGKLSLRLLQAGTSVVINPTPTGDDIQASLRLSGHYDLIDRIVGYAGTGLQDADDYDSPSEEFTGTLRGRLVLPRIPGRPGGSLDLHQGELSLVGNGVLGAVRKISFQLHAPTTDLAPSPCSDGTMPLRRTLAVQPVYVRADPTDSTADQESYFATELAKANDLWGRCCIQFEAGSPAYLDRPTLQVITADPDPAATSAEETDLFDEFVDDDAVEIFVIESFLPETAHGGGASWGGGKATARIITGVNNLPGYQRHLAHLLGHILSLCHPLTGCSPPRSDASAGTIMGLSNFANDHPDTQSASNCLSAANPLLRYRFATCCPTPDDPKVAAALRDCWDVGISQKRSEREDQPE
ncbi:MAG: hypothetical protein HY650_08890 [Acidobacteria bacterium]|nr:hypothetical protein [Acidobacteriota bacterium]